MIAGVVEGCGEFSAARYDRPRHRDAAGDLENIKHYIGREDGAATERLIEHIRRVILLLGEYPGLGTRGLVDGTSEMPVPRTRYVIIYRVDLADRDELVILRVYHVAQHRQQKASPGSGEALQ